MRGGSDSGGYTLQRTIIKQKRFVVRINESETECPTCKSEMIRPPCCDQFRPKSIIDDDINNFEVWAKYFISCVCKVINKLPPKAMSWKYSRL